MVADYKEILILVSADVPTFLPKHIVASNRSVFTEEILIGCNNVHVYCKERYKNRLNIHQSAFVI